MATRNILNYLNEVIGVLELPDDTPEEVWESKLAKYAVAPAGMETFYFPSLAVDRDGVDQTIAVDDWVTVESERVIWDLNENYDSETDDIVIEMDGIYSFDIQLNILEQENVKDIELAIFKRETEADDYWFILDKQKCEVGESIHLNGNTSFDFYSGDRYCLKIKANKIVSEDPCSFVINGSDDYTAWGYNFIRKI